MLFNNFFTKFPLSAPAATTEVEGNVITNGTFDSETGWTLGTGWAISTGKARATTVSGEAALDASSDPLTGGKTYQVSFTVTVTSGDVAVYAGNTIGTTRTTSGTYTENLLSAATGAFGFYSPTTPFTGTIDDVSAVEVA